jgi:hypothetical protein
LPLQWAGGEQAAVSTARSTELGLWFAFRGACTEIMILLYTRNRFGVDHSTPNSGMINADFVLFNFNNAGNPIVIAFFYEKNM